MIDIQRAIYEKLTMDDVINTSVVSITDNPVQDDTLGLARFPYIYIGDENVNDWDTDTELGFTATINIHVWDRGRGKKRLKEIQEYVYQALHRATDIALTGYNVIDIVHESSESFTDADNVTQHGVQVFNMTLQEV